jgi:D-glycero-D-manno-heptose 1,7-bisphosphate phosphatase
MIGDSVRDIEAGASVRATTVLVLTGYGRGELAYQSHRWSVKPAHVAEDLLDAVSWILAREQAQP